MRWFFLCNLIRDVAEIQTLPYTPYSPQQANLHQPLPQQQYYEQQYPNQQQQQASAHGPASDLALHHPEEEWRDHCLRGILSYPPGTQRTLVMDAMRQELVQSLNQYLRHVDSNVQRIKLALQPGASKSLQQIHSTNTSSTSDSSEDPYWESDTEIVRQFERGIVSSEEETLFNLTRGDRQQATLSISDNGASIYNDGADFDLTDRMIEQNRRAMQEIKEYLPQLVSAVLKSPPPFDPNLVDPVQKLRDLVINRCHEDPSWGIELCWLLEAEVGRAWKNLFEHRQQTGKRLIIVLPAEKAAVLAKIGTEKREAFDLLQDAERVTAYGYATGGDLWHEYGAVGNSATNAARLPSSLSLLRCSHFGDTMHFIDRLTKISLDLRIVPTIERHVRFQFLFAFNFIRRPLLCSQLLFYRIFAGLST